MSDMWLNYCKSFIPRIKSRHKEMLGRDCDLDNPKRITDKIEWLKVYDSTYLKTYCSDKITAREYVASKLGVDISIPILGIYSDFSSIDFSAVPQSYVLKTNHGSHTNIIVRDGNIDMAKARHKFNEWMGKDWSWWGYELFYKLIPRRVFVEKYMNDGHRDLVDYKFLCFNGVPLFCQVIMDRHNSNRHLNYMDMQWRPCTGISRKDFPANYSLITPPPSSFELMKKYATILSKDFRFVRVDFYEIDSICYFGELTFAPGAGYIQYTDDTVDYKLGSLLRL